MAKKWATAAQRFEEDLGQLFNRAIRTALAKGLAMAVLKTVSSGAGIDKTGAGKHDSSNAAAHWTIKAKGKQRTAGRAWTRLRDLRYTKDRKRTPPIGKRRDRGKNRLATVAFVRRREQQDVIDKFVLGRSPSTVFTFFNPIEDGTDYAKYVELTKAGEEAVKEVHRVLKNRLEAGKVRKRRL